MMKRFVYSILSAFLALSLVFSCTACKSNSTKETDGAESKAVEERGISALAASPDTDVADVANVSKTVATVESQDPSPVSAADSKIVNRFSNQKGATKISDYILNYDVHYLPGIEGYDKEAIFSLCTGTPKGLFNSRIFWNTIKDRGLGDYYPTAFNAIAKYISCEWSSNDVPKAIKAANPANREAALEVMFDWLDEQFEASCNEKDENGKWVGCFVGDSFIRYNHYAAERGAQYTGYEPGCNIMSAGGGVAYARGAAKQYGLKGFWCEHSDWWLGGYPNYTGSSDSWAGAYDTEQTETTGLSPSLKRRLHFFEYMVGTSWARVDAHTSLMAQLDASGQYYQLSPHGLVFQEFYEFTERNSDRGITYAPFGIVLDYYHGFPYAAQNEAKAFEVFSLNDGDKMNLKMNELFWPESYPNVYEDETGMMVATPYGETADVMLQNASQEVLDSYPVLILSGAIQFKDGEAERYVKYVENGGTLVLNTAYQSQLSAFKDLAVGEHNYGTKGGRVIVYGPDYDITNLPAIMEKLTKEYIPFEISGKTQWIMNVRDGSLVLTIFNNEGCHREGPSELATADEAATQTITVKYTGTNKVLEVRDWVTGELLPTSGEQTLVIGPGDLAVVEFVL